MKFLVLVLGFFLLNTSVFSQNDKFNIAVSYPVLLNEDFVIKPSEIIDVGIGYRFLTMNSVAVGVSLNGTFLKVDFEGEREELGRITIWEPKIFAVLTLDAIKPIEPYLGIGYTYFRKYEEFDFGETELTTAGGGFGLSIGTSVKILKGLYGNIEYDYGRPNIIPINQPDFIENTKRLRKLDFVKVGVGYRF